MKWLRTITGNLAFQRPMKQSGGPPEPGIAGEVFYDIAMRRLTEQIQRADAIDAKTAAVFSVGSVILPVSAAIMVVQNRGLSWVSLFLFAIGAFAYIGLLVFSFLAYRDNEWDFRPDPPTLQQNSETHTNEAMRIWVARECVVSITYNEPLLRQKVQYLSLAVVCLPAEAVALMLAALIAIR